MLKCTLWTLQASTAPRPHHHRVTVGRTERVAFALVMRYEARLLRKSIYSVLNTEKVYSGEYRF